MRSALPELVWWVPAAHSCKHKSWLEGFLHCGSVDLHFFSIEVWPCFLFCIALICYVNHYVNLAQERKIQGQALGERERRRYFLLGAMQKWRSLFQDVVNSGGGKNPD